MSNHKITATPVPSAGGNGEDQTKILAEQLDSDFLDSQILSDIFSDYLFIAFNQPPKLKDNLT